MKEPFNNQTELINAHLPLVRKLAAKIASKTSYAHMDDLIQEGSIGLIMAARAFNPKYKVLFRSYARHRIEGRMKDFLRTDNTFGVRNHWFTKVNLPLSYAAQDPPTDTTDILKPLTPYEREIVEMSWVEGYTRKEIGAIKNLTINQVRIIINRAKEKLKP